MLEAVLTSLVLFSACATTDKNKKNQDQNPVNKSTYTISQIASSCGMDLTTLTHCDSQNESYKAKCIHESYIYDIDELEKMLEFNTKQAISHFNQLMQEATNPLLEEKETKNSLKLPDTIRFLAMMYEKSPKKSLRELQDHAKAAKEHKKRAQTRFLMIKEQKKQLGCFKEKLKTR